MKRKKVFLGLVILVMVAVVTVVAAEKFCFQVPNCTGNDSCIGEVIRVSGCTITCITGSTSVSVDCPALEPVPIDDEVVPRDL